MKNLYTTFYCEQNEERRWELAHCLSLNLGSKLFNRIYLLTEEPMDEPEILSDLISIFRLNRRPRFSDLFELVNKTCGKDDINIISNSDIIFDESINLVDAVDMTDIVFALSRWDIQEDGSLLHHCACDSQDSWIFKGPVRDGMYADFELGTPGSDNRICHEFEQMGYNVVNPSKSIICKHLQLSNHRNYDGTHIPVPMPYKLIHPTYLEIK